MSDEHFVYIVAPVHPDGPFGTPVKIGFSRSVTGRLAQFNTATWVDLHVRFSFRFPSKAIAKEAEKLFHDVLEARKIKGEWFDLTELEAIELMIFNCMTIICLRTEDTDEIINAMVYCGCRQAHNFVDEIRTARNEEPFLARGLVA